MYGGANSLNSFYDKDDGPIGGLAEPPPVDNTTFYLSWAIQLIGFLLSFNGPRAFTWWFLAGMIMSVCYSHPRIRLKGSPIGSVVVVSFMQGFGAYCAGWIAGGRPVIHMLNTKGILGAVGVQAMTIGLYPLTQVYQYKDDIKHKDNTLAVALGIERSFQFSIFFVLLAGFFLSWMTYSFYSKFQAAVLIAYILSMAYVINLWGKGFDVNNVKYNFAILHRINTVNAICFFGFTLGHFTGLLSYI